MRFSVFAFVFWAVLLGPVLLPAAGIRPPGAGLAYAQSAAPTAIGEVSFMAGAVRAAVGGQTRALRVGDPVYQGDTLETGASGHLHIKTADKGFLALRPSSRAQIELYEFDPAAHGATRIRLKLDAGVMRAISGEGAQAARQNFRLNTPVAAIGIRGTDFSVSTTDQLTRAVVRTGAIVIAGFGADCRADALGPCRGDLARQLSSDQVGKLLELRRGQTEPALLDIRPGSGAPDQTAPPSAAEPRAAGPADKPKVAASQPMPAQTVPVLPLVSQSAAVVSETEFRAAIASALPLAAAAASAPPAVAVSPDLPAVVAPAPVPVIVAGQDAPAAAAPPVAEIPPAAVAAPVITVKAPPEAVVNWGRWQSIAGAAPGVAVNAFVAQNGSLLALNRLYVLAGGGAENLRLPSTGEFAFKLSGFEAYLFDGVGSSPTAATLDQGALTVDFGRSRFTTSLDVTAQSVAYRLRAQGQLTSDGMLFGNIPHTDGLTNTNVKGALAGAQGERAAYLFDYAIDPRRSIVGAAGWQR